jgi:hypothetical protein
LAVFFLDEDVGADFLCRFTCVGVSSDSSSRFPAAFLVELRGVGVGAPGVSVPPRVVTIAIPLLWFVYVVYEPRLCLSLLRCGSFATWKKILACQDFAVIADHRN